MPLTVQECEQKIKNACKEAGVDLDDPTLEFSARNNLAGLVTRTAHYLHSVLTSQEWHNRFHGKKEDDVQKAARKGFES